MNKILAQTAIVKIVHTYSIQQRNNVNNSEDVAGLNARTITKYNLGDDVPFLLFLNNC